MLEKAIINTKTHEIHLIKSNQEEWSLDIYSIQYGVRDLIESHKLRGFTTALVYLQRNYLKEEKLNAFFEKGFEWG